MALETLVLAALKKFFLRTATSLFKSAWEKAKAAPAIALAEYQENRSKVQELSDNISTTCQKLPDAQAGLMAKFLGNEETAAALVRLIDDGAFDAANIQKVLESDAFALSVAQPALEAVAISVQNTFQACISGNEVESHYLTLRELRNIRQQTSQGIAATERVETAVKEVALPKIEAIDTKLDELKKIILDAGKQSSSPPQKDAFVHNITRQASIEELTERLESQYNNRVEAANKALSGGQTETALKIFRELYAEVEHQTDPSSQKICFRAANGMAISYWYAHENTEARKWFEKTTELPGNEKFVRRNRMLIRVIDGDKQGAAALAEAHLVEYPHDFDGASLLANLALEAEKPEEALRLFEKHSDGSLNFLLALAGQNLRLNRFDVAKGLATEALKLSPDNRDAKVALADAIALPVVAKRNEIQSDRGLSPDDRQALEYALPVYEDALSEQNRPQTMDGWQRLVVNYSSFASILGDLDKAKSCTDTFLKIYPESISTLENAFIISVKQKDDDRAIQQAELLLKLNGTLEHATKLLEILTQIGRNSEMMEAYRRLLVDYPELEHSSRVQAILGKCLFQLGESEKAFAVLNQACAATPLWPPALIIRAQCYESEGKKPEAEEDLKRACAEEKPTWHWLGNYEYGMLLARSGRWEEAVERFENCGGSEIDSTILPEYLVALSNLGKWKECIEILEKRPANAAFNEILTDLEANCRLHVYDFKGAESCLRKLTDRHGTNANHWGNLAHVLYRQDKIDAAIATLRRAIQLHPASSDIWLNLSRMCLFRGRKKEALEAASEAARLSPDSDSVHRWIFAIGQMAVQGEELPQTFIPLLQRTFNYLVQKPDSGFTQISVAKHLKDVKKSLRQMHRSVRKTTKIYNSTPAPIHILRTALGRDLTDLWLLAVGGAAGLRVRMSRGNQEDQATELAGASTGESVVVELTGLLTMGLCDQLDVLPKLFKDVLIPTTVFEELKNAAEALVFESNTAGMMALEGGRPVFVQNNPTVRQNQVALFGKILDFCKSPLVQLVPLPPQALGDSLFEQRADLLGVGAAHAGLLAVERKAILLSDDWLYRTLFLNEHKVKGTCTQAVLRIAERKRLLTFQDYQRKVLLLIQHHYTFVADEPGTFMALVQNGHKPQDDLSIKLLGRFASGEVTRTPAAMFFGFFLGGVRRLSREQGQEEWTEAIYKYFMEAKPTIADAHQFTLGLAWALSNTPELCFDVLLKLRRNSSVNLGLFIEMHKCIRNLVREIDLFARQVHGIQISKDAWRAAWKDYQKMSQILWDTF